MNAGGVGWRVAEKIRGDLGKSARVRWKVAAKIPGELRRSGEDNGKLLKRFAANP